jgi:hypothetical protein
MRDNRAEKGSSLFWPLAVLMLLLLSVLLSLMSGVQTLCPPVCLPGNKYWAGLYAKDQTLSVQRLPTVVGSLPLMVEGSVLMIIQMQGGTINNTNSTFYGSGKGTGNG